MEIDDALLSLGNRMQRILGLLAEGRRSLEVPDASEWKALALARWEMMRALDDFIAFKERCVLDPLAHDGGRADQVAGLRRQNEALSEAYAEFVRRWSLTSTLDVDIAYRAEALKMAERIERQVIADVQELERMIRAA